LDGYLLDTQTICYWFDGASGKFPKVASAIKNLTAGAPLYVSAVTLGEIEFGHAINPAGAGPKRNEFITFVRTSLPQILEISRHTAEPYGLIRAHLAQKFPPTGGWNKKRRVEQMVDPVTGMQLSIDENDLWLVAQAVERGLVFVSSDKMLRIRQAVAEVYPTFLAENWAV
jgi:tRNA(fMet)-specific endonuclease VapC